MSLCSSNELIFLNFIEDTTVALTSMFELLTPKSGLS
jgi:hypothetical protein